MKEILPNQDIAAEIERLIGIALGRLVAVPGFWYKVRSISFVPSTSPATGRQFTKIGVELLTNNRPLLLGQFLPFPVNGLMGYHANYIFGLIQGYFAARYAKDLWHDYYLVLDVSQADEAPRSLYRYVTVNEAISQGVLSPDSPLHKAMQTYKVKYVLLSGSTLSGPSLALMASVERLTQQARVRSMLDIFCGTGSLSKVARLRGVRSVVCIDVNLDREHVADNLGPYAAGCELVQSDAYQYEPRQFFDLVVLDPFYQCALDAAERLVPRLTGHFAQLLMNLGPPEEHYWVSRIVAALEGHQLRVATDITAGQVIALCRP
ncbi:MAG TPA: hypothetical protein VM537_02310 [Anaerolineae bacterium]|nr:hypothetical protein [Anaerolineae bacterium]